MPSTCCPTISVQEAMVQQPFQSKTEGPEVMHVSHLSRTRDLAKVAGAYKQLVSRALHIGPATRKSFCRGAGLIQRGDENEALSKLGLTQ